MATYSWLTLSAAISALQARLGNGGAVAVPSAEAQAYLTQSLREWNALTEQAKSEFVFSVTGAQTWYNTGTLAGSPRLRSVTDANLYTMMQYMLLEPPTGAGTWTGTNQFTLSDLQLALQRRTQEVIQASSSNLAQLAPLASTPGTLRTLLADTVLEPRRIRFIPATGFGNPITLTREDTQAFQFFIPGYIGSQPSTGPQSWSVASEPPLAFDVDNAPSVAGTYDAIALNSGPTFAPPAPSLLGVPDDWSPLPMWGALADVLGGESEKTDRERSAYCLKRFTDGLNILRQSNWLVQANVNGVPCDTPSLYEMDWTSPEWQNNAAAWPALVQAGMDLVGVCPVAGASVGVTLIGNAPILDGTGTYLQIARDQWDVVLNYAQRLATFKDGGQEFAATEPLELDFYRAAQETNRRLLDMGIFTDMLNSEGQRQNENVPRLRDDQQAIAQQNQQAVLRALGGK
jgi:hypothetical protein